MKSLQDIHVQDNTGDYLSLWTKPQPIYVVGSQPRGSVLELKSILREVADEAGVTTDDLLGQSRLKKIAHARQKFMALAWETRRFSEPRIGRFVGRDPSTINHGKRAHRRREAAKCQPSSPV